MKAGLTFLIILTLASMALSAQTQTKTAPGALPAAGDDIRPGITQVMQSICSSLCSQNLA